MRDEPQYSDPSSDFADAPTSLATLEPPAGSDTCDFERTGPQCEKCAAPIKSDVVAICRRCGWYASLGTFVELDQNWEIYTDQAAEPAAVEPQKSHVRVWLDLMPRWGWVILASVLVVVVESVVARLATPAYSALRTTWSLSQLVIGVIVATACHIFNFVVLAAEDADFGVMDLFLKPLKLWLRAVHRLPTRLWVANAAACGVVAAAMSMLVIGGLPYERLWDWGFKQPVKQDLMGAVMDRAKELDSGNDGELEDAIGDFAGKANTDAEDKPKTPPKPREKSDCVILGYQVDRSGRLDTLILGAVHKKHLIYAGRVSPEMPEDERRSLLAQLVAIKTLRPFISIEADGTWVKPKFTCRITYGEKLRNGQLRDVKWDALLGTVNTESR
jgi:hypothetical protein